MNRIIKLLMDQNHSQIKLDNQTKGGWYARDLEYKDQIDYHNKQRSFLNQIESLPTLIITTVVSGLYFPIPSLVGVWLNFVARIFFAIGYYLGA